MQHLFPTKATYLYAAVNSENRFILSLIFKKLLKLLNLN